ncbi:S-layer homology domain-containing protein [Domibacillus sp. A3M-37]|uniref:S-layer homology domain-containing protein n=1 Tax=Domibacillus sp. A3M-37 TaxID=2962037 RepID=UPI0020B682CE|nr:S-layer homology domain-containing protein [Domibacillus sp. A3M-37]MCP3764337.1 S-layer homology domain-containing protein [Domibacillus sp. A3M-37]
MKKSVQTVGLLSVLAAGLSFSGQASAASSACSAYGDVQPGVNPSYQHVNCLVTEEALEQEIPPEVVKAVITQENGDWKHFDQNGNAIVSADGGIGLMQLTNQSQFDPNLLKTDLIYNIESGVKVLDKMYDRNVPKIAGADGDVIENWYFPVMAYNGLKPVNSPIKKETGQVNTGAYQEQVFAKIEAESYLKDTNLTAFPFQAEDFQYSPDSDENIVFNKMRYSLTEKTHKTVYQLKAGDRVITKGSLKDIPKLRKVPGGTSTDIITSIPENTVLTVTGSFQYDQNSASTRQFVWYPVKTASGESGFISSAYIEKTDKPALSFSDVPAGYGFYNDIMALTSQGIINGFDDNSFRPDENVTRRQAAIMMLRALELPYDGMDVTVAIEKHGIMSGYTDGHFYENRPVTRAQMAIILANAFDLTKTAPISFIDVHDKMKAYEAIKQVVAANISKGYTNNTFRPDQPVIRQEFAALLNRALQQ